MDSVYSKFRSQHVPSVDSLHTFLVKGRDEESCLERVTAFFQTYELLRYSRVAIDGDPPVKASSPEFWKRIEEGLRENRKRIGAFIEELRREGVESLDDLASLPQGHLTNTLHTATHLLDGFFGIDSFFFNLVEETHEVSDGLRRKIEADPGEYMILSVRGSA